MAKVINMIFGRLRDWGVTSKEESVKKQRLDNNIISFLKDDVWRIQTPYDDAFVISMMIANYDVKIILIDNESSNDILFYSTFSQMRLPTD